MKAEQIWRIHIFKYHPRTFLNFQDHIAEVRRVQWESAITDYFLHMFRIIEIYSIGTILLTLWNGTMLMWNVIAIPSFLYNTTLLPSPLFLVPIMNWLA